jgi:hypothetical protein
VDEAEGQGRDLLSASAEFTGFFRGPASGPFLILINKELPFFIS